ncbi:MAG: DUF3575 domain-containing protein, partial [Tannerellaceae bacterium]|nr:DUF3575 domain-containing protein [Tannerellaceae bacterium]
MDRKTTMGLLLAAFLFSQGVKAQYYTLSTNLAAWAVGSINLEASASLGRKVSLHLPLQYNPFVLGGGRRVQHLTV